MPVEFDIFLLDFSLVTSFFFCTLDIVLSDGLRSVSGFVHQYPIWIDFRGFFFCFHMPIVIVVLGYHLLS